MTSKPEAKKEPLGQNFYIRRLNKAGGSRYLSVGKILPVDWEAVKVYVRDLPGGWVELLLVQIK